MVSRFTCLYTSSPTNCSRRWLINSHLGDVLHIRRLALLLWVHIHRSWEDGLPGLPNLSPASPASQGRGRL
eukprot:1346285-Amphidinium_carterae.1